VYFGRQKEILNRPARVKTKTKKQGKKYKSETTGTGNLNRKTLFYGDYSEFAEDV